MSVPQSDDHFSEMENFIKHFRSWMSRQASDARLKPHHVSLYLVLFHYWNLNHFQNPVIIRRKEVMENSKIGSFNTYSRCLHDLHTWKYITYQVSYNAQYPSKVVLFTFDPGSSPPPRTNFT